MVETPEGKRSFSPKALGEIFHSASQFELDGKLRHGSRADERFAGMSMRNLSSDGFTGFWP